MTLRGATAIAGIGETTYYRRGGSPEPEFKLGLRAIIAAAEDAGIDVREIDGFASYSNDRNDPTRLATALGTRELRFSNMGTLMLSPNGTYRTNSTSGRFVRGGGDTIRLVSGQFAGAVGHLQPDKSGRPGVYFERDENRNAQGVHIVDPQRTSCTVARGG